MFECNGVLKEIDVWNKTNDSVETSTSKSKSQTRFQSLVLYTDKLKTFAWNVLISVQHHQFL